MEWFMHTHIFPAARLLIDKHGAEATIHAALRADELLEAGDLDGYAVWKALGDLNCNTSQPNHSPPMQ